MKNSEQIFLDEIEGFLAKTGKSATAFGREALYDPTFVFELRRGRSVSLAIADRVRQYMHKVEAA